MANRTGTSRNSSKKNIKNSVILNSEETMRKMDIFGDTLFGKEKEEEKVTETVNLEIPENENVTEKVEEIVPIQEETIDDLDFENSENPEPQATLTEEVTNFNDIAQNSGEEIAPEEVAPVVEDVVEPIIDANATDPSIEEVAMDDILSMIDEENEEEAKTEESMGSMDLSSNIEQNSQENNEPENIVEETTQEISSPSTNLSDFSSEILGNASNADESISSVDTTAEISNPEDVNSFNNEVNTQDGMKIEDLLIGNSLLEMMQNADVDVTAIERTEGREALKMIGEE